MNNMDNHVITDNPAFRTVAATTSTRVHITQFALHGTELRDVGRVVLSEEEFDKITALMRR